MLDALTPVLSQMLKRSIETISSSTIIPTAPFIIILGLQCFRLASKILPSLPMAQLPPSLVGEWASSAVCAMSHVRWEDGGGGRHTKYNDDGIWNSQLCLSTVLFDVLQCFPHAYYQLLCTACNWLDNESCDSQEVKFMFIYPQQRCCFPYPTTA